jgi:hypothetical protein
MPAKRDITGQKFARLLVIGYSEKKTKANKRMVWCQCDCGSIKEQVAANLVSGMAKSCGCLVGESAKERFTKHGHRYHPLYNRYRHMLQRCYSINSEEYKNYGARGITVCDEWRKSFAKFAEDMGAAPFASASIDRIDNNKCYSKENCHWATKKEQSTNRRNVTLIEYDGQTMCISDWEKKLGFGSRSLRARLAAGMSIDEAFTLPKIPKGRYIRK